MSKAFIGMIAIYVFATMLSFASEGVKGTVSTTLSAITPRSATTLNVASTTDFPTAGTILIGEEQINYTGKTATTFTGATRGANGTEAKGYASGSVVFSEALGLLDSTLKVEIAESVVPGLGEFKTAFNIAGQFGSLVFKMIAWDYSWFDQDVLGIPLRIFQYFFYALSVAIIINLYLLVRGGGIS